MTARPPSHAAALAEPAHPPLRSRLPAAGALSLLGYLVLALVMFWGPISSGGTRAVGVPGDPSLFMWSLRWVPFALGHGLNPLVTTYQNYPSGVNLMWNTSIVFPALVMAPVTLLFGAVTSYNLLALLGLALSAFVAYLAFRRYVTVVPAWLGGLLFGFSPFVYRQSLGHLHLSIAIFLPLMLVLGDELLVRQRWRPWVLGLLLGVATACQLLTGEEILAMTAVIAVAVLMVLMVLHWRMLRPRLPYIGRAAAFALLSFAVLAAYPLYAQFFGPQRVYGILQPQDVYEATLKSFLLPTSYQLIGFPALTATRDSDAFIGVPLLLVALAAVVFLRRRRLAALCGAVAVVAMVLSLGGVVHVPYLGTFTGPWKVLERLPLLGNIAPIRFMVFAYLALGLLIALVLDAALATHRLRTAAAVCCAAAIAMVPLLPHVPSPQTSWPVPQFFTTQAVQQIPTGASVLTAPVGTTDAQMWQQAAGFRYRTPLSWAFYPGPSGPLFGSVGDPLPARLVALQTDATSSPTVTSAERGVDWRYLRARKVTVIIAAPQEARVIEFITNLLGAVPQQTSGMDVWSNIDTLDAA